MTLYRRLHSLLVKTEIAVLCVSGLLELVSGFLSSFKEVKYNIVRLKGQDGDFRRIVWQNMLRKSLTRRTPGAMGRV